MNYAKKMILVPFNPQRPDRELEQLNKMDEEMNDIFNKKNTSLSEKIQLYNQILNKFIDKNENIEFKKRDEVSQIIQNNIKEEKIDPETNIKKELKDEVIDTLEQFMIDKNLSLTDRKSEVINEKKKKSKKQKTINAVNLSTLKTRGQRKKALEEEEEKVKNKNNFDFPSSLLNFNLLNKNDNQADRKVVLNPVSNLDKSLYLNANDTLPIDASMREYDWDQIS